MKEEQRKAMADTLLEAYGASSTSRIIVSTNFVDTIIRLACAKAAQASQFDIADDDDHAHAAEIVRQFVQDVATHRMETGRLSCPESRYVFGHMGCHKWQPHVG